MAKSRLRLVGSPIVKRTVRQTPRRRPNAELRTREYLTPPEIDKLIVAAKKNRWGARDATMILVAYRHGLHAAELVGLEWSQFDFDGANHHVRRVKQGTPSVHPLRGDELRPLRQLQRGTPNLRFVFVSERNAPFTTAGFARMIERAGIAAGFKFKAHPHQLRHACGYALANKGVDTRSLQAYLGHRSIVHTTRYAELVYGSVQGLLAGVSMENDDRVIPAESDPGEFPAQIDLGEIVTLHMDVVEAAPCPEIFIGSQRRIDPGPPTTRALAEALTRWREELEAKPTEGAGPGKPGPAERSV
jgi:type 1 fimbriae regulatory protein FimB/type 1 fimbriae regulatory protein FimE